MSIDPITFEIRSDGRPPKSIYVWDVPVRIWHWLMAICMVILIASGLLIGDPITFGSPETWTVYGFGYVRLVHYIAAMIFTALFIGRVYWLIPGNRYARMIFFPPLWSLKWWKGVITQAGYYLFLVKNPPEYAGHNPLAQLAMFAMFVLGSIGVIITGFALYAQAWGWDTGWMWFFGWVFDVLGDSQCVRTVHHVLTYVFLLFCVAHCYMAIREDVMGGVTTLSSMGCGLRMFKETEH